MNVTKIEMPVEEAKAKLMAYRKALLRRGDAEYRQVLEGFEALARGTPVISLSEAIRGGGFDEKMRPKLAVARADRKQVRVFWAAHTHRALFITSAGLSTWSPVPGLEVRVDIGRAPGLRDGQYFRDADGYALIPMIPADVRPRGLAKNWFILWEVEAWSDSRIGARADRDPYLLKHLGGDMYAVLAEWNLTELERLVMAGRAQG